MAASQAWKSKLQMSERYEIVQTICSSLPAGALSEAISIERTAYETSSTREEYDAACVVTHGSSNIDQEPSDPQPHHSLQTEDEHQHSSSESETGIRIASYSNCLPIADGVTSTVFRSSNRALKVITTPRTLEPHNPQREIRILKTLQSPCISLIESFRDQEQKLVLVFPYMPHTLADILDTSRTALSHTQINTIFSDVLTAVANIHSQGIIHRDIKPSAILLQSPHGPAYLSDFGTAWHPDFSSQTEPATAKILDIGTGAYRAPEALFGNAAYGTAVDMWGVGVMLSEAITSPPKPVFESRPAHEDGSQLGLILSIFKTLGTPNETIWPEAKDFKVSPFELWTVFPQISWEEILPHADPKHRDLIAALIKFDSSRATAQQALTFPCFATTKNSQN